MSPRRLAAPVSEDEALLLSALLDGELAPRDRAIAERLLEESPEAALWLESSASVGELGRDVWEEHGALARVAEPGPAYAHVAFRLAEPRVNGTAFRSGRWPRDDSSDT